jgi:hypothetical protein
VLVLAMVQVMLAFLGGVADGATLDTIRSPAADAGRTLSSGRLRRAYLNQGDEAGGEGNAA